MSPRQTEHDASTPCPKGLNGIHRLVREEGTVYVCVYCDAIRMYDPDTGKWK